MKGLITERISFWETLFRRLSKLRYLAYTEEGKHCMIIPILHAINLRVLVKQEPAVDFADRLCTLLERACRGEPFRAEARKVLWEIERKRRRYRERENDDNKRSS